ncbi:FAD/NAD(P)-binding domain-containing protein, partial [Hortaea werneckii]
MPASKLVTPDDVRQANMTLEQSVLQHGWPKLDDVRGRFMFFFDNDPDNDSACTAIRSIYRSNGHESLQDRVVFTNSVEGDSDAAFMKYNNPTKGGLIEIQRLVKKGYIVRTRADTPITTLLEKDLSMYNTSWPSGAQIVSTDWPAYGMSARSIMAAIARKPILISGAGVSSLLLGQSLLRASIPFVIFERDASISFRAQGYRLRLSAEGLDAIESALGPNKFQTFWDICGKTGGGGLRPLDARTGEDIGDPPKEGDKPRPVDQEQQGKPMQLGSRGGKVVGIARGDMRKLFYSGCEPYVRWSHNVTGYELTASGVHAVFADGSKSEEGSMLIAGEGVHSKVAKQVSQGKLKTYDTGARGIHGQAPTTAFKGLGEGVWRVVDDTRPEGKVFIITNVRPDEMGDPNVNFGWTMAGQPGVIKPPNDDYAIIGKPAADIAKGLTQEWHPRFKPLFDQMAESEAAFWKITC